MKFIFEVKRVFRRIVHSFYNSVNSSVKFCKELFKDTKEIQEQFQLINTLMEYFHSGLVLNTVIDKLYFLRKLVKNRLNEVWQHAAHCPYLVDNLKHGHWNFNGKYLKSANFSYCSLNVDSVLGYCLCLYYITLTECTLVCKKWENVEMQVNLFSVHRLCQNLYPP